MKYQTFNSSCCYAGLANLLEEQGSDVEDRDIILGGNIPYMLRYEQQSRSFLAGPMLQGAQWFDLYLRPRGLRFVELRIPRDRMLEYLWNVDRRVMLGVNAADGGKQALVFEGVRGDNFRFLNSKWQKSPAPEHYMYPAAQLLDCLDEQNVAGHLEKCESKKIDFCTLLDDTQYCVDIYRECLDKFFAQPRHPYELSDAGETLLRALLVDLYTMAELTGEARLALMIKLVRDAFLRMQQKDCPVLPSQEMPLDMLAQALERYKEIVFNRAKVIARGNAEE